MSDIPSDGLQLTENQKRELRFMAIHDALSEVGVTYSINTKLALQGQITAQERQKRQSEAFNSAFDTLVKLFDSMSSEAPQS